MTAQFRLLTTGGLLAAALLSIGAYATHANEAAAPGPTAAAAIGKDALREQLRALLLEEPEIVIEAINAYQQREEERRAEQIAAALPNYLKEVEKLVEAGERVMVQGDPNGDITLVEFADYNCPVCRQVQPQIREFLKGDPKIRHVVKALAYIGSPFPEMAITAAAKQGDQEKVIALHNEMMGFDGRLSNDDVLAMAAKVGLDAERIKKEANDPDVRARLERTIAIARALNIEGTPALVFPDRITSYATSEELTAIVSEIRATR